jgi:hypothetical protein
MRISLLSGFVLVAVVLCCGPLEAEIYRTLKVSELPFAEKTAVLDEALDASGNLMRGSAETVIRSTVEAYVGEAADGGGERKQGNLEVVFRLEDESPVQGFIDLYETAFSPADPPVHGFAFTLDPAKAKECSKEHFEKIRAARFGELADRHLPGTAWFKYRAGADANAAMRPAAGLDDTFAIFSGGRAISENLALDRDLIIAAGEDKVLEVPLSQIKGVTVEAIDWSGRLPKEEVAVDSLSLAIPADQHALFAAGMPALLELVEKLETEITPAMQEFSVRGPFRRMASRYRAQLGLDGPDFAARLLPVKSVAITGGDPFFPLGSDVAVVFESGSPELLYQALLKGIEMKAAAAGATAVETGIVGSKAFQNADRSFSSHICRIGDLVAVANSPKPLERLVAVREKKLPSLGATEEFKFFRNRYPLGGDEKAFVFLSDAAIRRWCGPEMRIAASRRTRAVAALGELTSRAIAGEQLGDEFTPLLGGVAWKDGRVISARYGSLNFITPASELEIASATLPERDAYERWRDGYEQGWRRVFDPIAIRIGGDAKSLEFDLSLMPLTVGSELQEFVNLCGGAKLDARARFVSAGTLMHLAVALDTKSRLFHQFDPQLGEFLPDLKMNPLGWMTGMISVDLDDGLFWQADPRTMMESEAFAKAPVVLRLGSNSRLKLALFMTAVKAASASAAPDAMRWETRKRGDRSYVVVSENEGEGPAGFQVCYATMPKALLISLTEESLLLAMDREDLKATDEKSDGLPVAAQLMLDSSPAFLRRFGSIMKDAGPGSPQQVESWKALPILNEWHRMSPDRDPVELHRIRYGSDVSCPGGKGYRWNAEAMTMESAAYGFPVAPRDEPVKIHEIENVRTGLVFQDGGLRATARLGPAPERVAVGKVATGGAQLATAAELTPLIEGMELVYEGKSGGGPSGMTVRSAKIRKEGAATLIENENEWTAAEGGITKSKDQARLEGALFIERNGWREGASVYTKPLMILPENLVAGEVTKSQSAGSAQHREDDKDVEDGPFRGETRIRVVGKEDVKVAAGEFPGCVRIETVNEILDRNGYHSSTHAMWYHPKVGMVKYKSLTGEMDEMELVEIRMPGADKTEGED